LAAQKLLVRSTGSVPDRPEQYNQLKTKGITRFLRQHGKMEGKTLLWGKIRLVSARM
jgi:hypothetical protein